MVAKSKQPAAELEPMLVAAKQAAHLCGVSPANWWKLVKSGRAPEPVRIGRKKLLWRVHELRKWIAQGCPPINRAQAEQYRRDREIELSQLTK